MGAGAPWAIKSANQSLAAEVWPCTSSLHDTPVSLTSPAATAASTRALLQANGLTVGRPPGDNAHARWVCQGVGSTICLGQQPRAP